METNNAIDVNSASVFEEMQLKKTVAKNGSIRYCNNIGQLHRVYGPAWIWLNGEEWWYLNGQSHRIGGPAITRPGDEGWYYLYGIPYSKEEYWKEVERIENEDQ